MQTNDVLALLAEVGALITNDHLVYTSGRHGSSYVNKDALYPHTAATSAVCAQIARHFATAAIEAVAGPAIGGVIMAQWTAYHLSVLTGSEVLAVYAEETTEGAVKRRVLRRGYDALVRGRRTLVVEDVLTTGGSARQTVEAVCEAGGEVVAVGALCNRGGVTAEQIGAPALYALVELSLESYAPEACPLCAAGVPINTRIGKGAAWRAARDDGQASEPV